MLAHDEDYVHQEGDLCPSVIQPCNCWPCSGVLEYPTPENCHCHLGCPPCISCTSVVLTCSKCGWTEEDAEELVTFKTGDKLKWRDEYLVLDDPKDETAGMSLEEIMTNVPPWYREIPASVNCRCVTTPIYAPGVGPPLLDTRSHVLQCAILATLSNALPTNDNRCTWAIQSMNDEE